MDWTIKGELILNCCCEVFCPCVISLGNHPPTEGYCQGWFGIRIDEGKANGADLSGLNVAMLLDIPGEMGRGNWTTAAFIDERASEEAFEALDVILSGQAGGSTSVFRHLVSNHMGAERETIDFTQEGETRSLSVGKKITGVIEPIAGNEEGETVRIVNSQYWVAPEIVVAQAHKSRLRAFGRVWNFANRSAEICQIDWSG